MIYYPLETLVKAGIKEILIVTGGEHIGDFFRLLGSGKEWGVHFSYEIQEGNGGTGAALLLAEDFVRNEEFMVILGDNVVSEDIACFVEDFKKEKEKFKAKILIAKVEDPQNYGVVDLKDRKIVRIVEKPKKPSSHYAVSYTHLELACALPELCGYDYRTSETRGPIICFRDSQ